MKTICILASLLVLLTFSTTFGASTVFFKDGTKETGNSVWLEGGMVFLSKASEIYEFSADEVLMEETMKHNHIGKYAEKASAGQHDMQKTKPANIAGKIAPISTSKISSHDESRLSSQNVLKDENLLMSVPNGYKIGFGKRQGNMQITEMVQHGEDVQSWTHMVTLQTFHGGVPQRTPIKFSKASEDSWKKVCRNAESHIISKGSENGYPFALWLQTCPLNPVTQKPEITMFKAIQGNDSFYVVQKAWKNEPGKDEIVNWTKYMKRVLVCDSRIKERACPSVK